MLRGLKQFNLPEIEEKILKFWQENKIFEKSLKNREGKKNFVFFEGPPTANGRPGMHHVLARAFKDIILRYKTMRGYYVGRRAGWDTHGLPVEIEVEKELGIKNKQGIEQFGIANFNIRAKMSVWKYKSEWEKLTERIGFWLDFDKAYVTYKNNYIETLWWVFAQIAKKGLLKKLYKIVPWCPRCQTPLSSHELGQPGVYKLIEDPSVYVKFKIKGRNKEYLLVWTTTPWTLPGNVAVAVNSKVTYTKYKVGENFYWAFNAPPRSASIPNLEDAGFEVSEKISGKKMVGWSYEPLYSNKGKHEVIAADFVSTEDGTGLVHIAPAFGEDDMRVAGEGEIPVTIDDRGMVTANVPGKGKFIKEADKEIIADLDERKLLYYNGTTEHEYPFCWRCSTPLIYFARNSWFVLMSKLRDELLAANKKINWIPENIQEGRFGEWLREIKDWAISRERYWGTPLPIWECTRNVEHRLFVGSLEDLNKHSYNKNKFFMARHCEGEHNVSGMLTCGPEKNGNGAKLTKKGLGQAEKLAIELKNKGIDFIYASPLTRTQQTAKIISKTTGAKIIIDQRLIEIQGGVFNGRPIGEYMAFFETRLERFTKTPPGGENYSDIKKRMIEFVLEINTQHQDKTILIVSHGDPLWVLAGALRGLKNEKIIEIEKEVTLATGEYSKLEFNNWPFSKEGELDLHRPFADQVFLSCPDCGEKMLRIKDVADVWFDSGAMPLAQWHYPFENKEIVDKGAAFPADYIAEGIDQTRGWFYTLLAVSTLLDRGLSYKNVIALGLLLDKNGQKMSKSKGNVVDPWQMIQKYGADVIRWYFYTVNPPGEPKKFDENDLRKTLNKLFMLIYNSFVFYNTYSSASSLQVAGKPIKVLDEWIIARLNQTIELATVHLEKYEIGEAAKSIEGLVEDFSRWYIRRSRKNFSPAVISEVLLGISKLMAPFAPFFSDSLYLSLVNSHKSSSVHLADWPKADKTLIDKDLLGAMIEIRRLASLALAEREKAGIKVRQPLSKLKIKNQKFKIKAPELLKLLADEINVKEVVFDLKIKGEIELDIKITSELREEGIMRELMRLVQGLRHDANCQVKDKIQLYLELPQALRGIVEKNLSSLKKQVNLKSVEFKKTNKFDAELKSKIEDFDIWIGLNK